MATNLMDMLQSYVTPDLIQKASSLIGESPANTQQAMGSIFPTLLAGLISKFSSGSGIGQLMGMLPQGAASSDLLNNAVNAFSGGAAANQVADKGQGILKSIFGDKAGAITDVIANHGGIKSTSAASLLSLAAPMLMGVLGKVTSNEGLGASGLTQLLASQKDTIARLAPPGLASVLGIGSLSNLGAGLSGMAQSGAAAVRNVVPAVPPAPSGMPKWLWPLIIILILLALLFYFLRGCNRSDVTKSTPSATIQSVTLPGGATLNLSTGSLNYKLATFLADKNNTNVPQTFVFDNLNFDSGTTNLTPESNQTVSDLAQILNAYPSAQVSLDGYTDNTGNAEANQQLSKARADAVKSMLEAKAVDVGRIATAGFGQEKPVASNDTDEGRGKNRRIELTVTQK